MSNGGGFDFGGLFSGLLGFLSGVVQWLYSVLVYLFRLVVFVFQFLWTAVVAVANFILGGFKVLAHALSHLIKTAYQQVTGQTLTSHIGLLGRLKAWFDRIRKWVHLLHRAQQQYVLRTLKNAINLIQRVRKILVIFRLFHLKFAQRLDNKLLQLEGRIIRKFMRIIQNQNRVLNIIELVLDPTLILRRDVMVRSVISALDDLLVGITGHGLRTWIGPGKGGPANVTAIASSQKMVSDFTAAAVDSTGPLYLAGTAAAEDYSGLVDRLLVS